VLGKARAAMSLAELEAAVGWLERNRVLDHADVLRDDPRYEWAARQRAAATRPGPHGPREPRPASQPRA
jgi:hypothetical protein